MSKAPLFAVVIVLLLAGCTTPALAPTPTPTTTVTAGITTPTPTPDPEVTLVTLTADAITLTESTGTIHDKFDYFQPTEDVVNGLTAAFGFEPSIERTQPYEGWPYTAYNWEGFTLQDSEQESDGVYYPNNRVQVTTASVRGVAIETIDGISVGDDASDIEAAHPDQVSYGTNSGKDVFVVWYGEIPLPDFDFGNGEDGPFRYWVSLMGEVDGPVSTIWAPSGGGPGI